MTRTKTRGFTLVELMTVIAIIALLMGILIPVVRTAQLRAREAAVKAQITNIGSGLEMFKADFGFYPSSVPQDQNGINASPDRVGVNNSHIIQGLNRLAFALVGRDRLGCPARRGTGTGVPATACDQGPDSLTGWYYSDAGVNTPAASFTGNWQDKDNWNSALRTARRGPYINLDGVVVVNDDNVSKTGTTKWSQDYIPVICDKFDKGKNDNITDYSKRSMILYFAANEQGQRLTRYNQTVTNAIGNLWSEEIYYAVDNWRITGSDNAPSQFRQFIEDPKAQVVNDCMPHNRESFLLISPGADGRFFTDDDIKNWSD